jgi:uncharacterized membrane protein HdeD (DUF308 family)
MDFKMALEPGVSLQGQQQWRIFVGIGAALALLGILASVNLLLATILATYIVGAAMFAGGIFQLFHAFSVRRFSSGVLWGLAALLYLITASILIIDPLLGASVLTIFIGLTLAASGSARLILAFRHREGRAWMILSGVISIVAALLVAVSWPWSSLWLLGMVLAIDLLSQGVMLMLFGFSQRSAASVQ